MILSIHKTAYALSAALLLATGAAQPAHARTKLTALPERESIRVNLEHPNSNLVTEERILSLREGQNEIDFSWQSVQIDPQTIQFEALDAPGEVRLINVSYPPGENALVWNVYSPSARQERVRIHYLLGGLARTASYRQDVAADESKATLETRFLLQNFSGEDFENAEISFGFGEPWTTDLRSGEAREILAFEAEIPVEKQYIYRAPSDREQTPLFYLLRNEQDWNLGRFKMPAGKVRFFQTDPRQSEIFLGEDWMKTLPVKEKAELTLGMARDVVVERNVLEEEVVNARRTPRGRVVLYDRAVTLRYETENFKDEAVTLKIVEPMSENWRVERLEGPGQPRWERKDNATLEIWIDLSAKGEKSVVEMDYVQRNLIPERNSTP